MADPDTDLELTGLLPLVASNLRARVRAELTPTKSRRASLDHRRKFLDSLYHSPPFDGRYIIEQYPKGVRAELVARNAPNECYVISNDSRYDGMTMQLDEALDRVGEGSILLCIPGQLAYYEGEDSSECWIVQRLD